MYWKKLLGITTLSCDDGSTKLLPEWPWRAQRSELFLRRQNNSGIFSYVLLLLQCFSSNFRQTNDDKTQHDPWDNLLFSRIQSLHHFLEVDFHDEEDGSISLTLDNRIATVFLVQLQSKFSPEEEKILWMSWPNLVFVVLLWPLIGSQNHPHSISTYILRTALLRFPARGCSSSWPMRNCDPRVRIVSADLILISTPYLPCKQQVATSNTGPISVFPLIQPFGSDVSSSLGKVYSRQATASVNCETSAVSFVMKNCPTSTVVRNPASGQNLHNMSCCDNFSIRSPYLCNNNSLVVGSSVPNAWRPVSAAQRSQRTALHSTRMWMRWEKTQVDW